jgi:putative DNA primase/helicase
MSGILNWALIGLERLQKQDGFTESKIVREKIRDYREKSDNVVHFLNERCEPGTNEDAISKQKLYEAYKRACMDWGVHGVSQMNFNGRVKVVYPMAQECRLGSSRAWRHIKYNYQSEVDDDFLS